MIDPDVEVEYETVETVTLSPAQTSITVDARDVEPANDPVAADVLTVLVVPIAGIATVTNPAPAQRAAAAETDAELRIRARNVLQGGEKATLGAFRSALARQHLQGEIAEPADRPGTVIVSPVAESLTPERREQLLAALEDTRAAGVRVELAGAAAPARVSLEIEIATREGLPDPDRAAAHEAVRAAIAGFFATLPIREDARVNRIVGLVLAVPGVEDVTLLAAPVEIGGVVTDRLDAAAGIIALADTPTVLAELSISDPAPAHAGRPGDPLPRRRGRARPQRRDRRRRGRLRPPDRPGGPARHRPRARAELRQAPARPPRPGRRAARRSPPTTRRPSRSPPLPTTAAPYEVTLFIAQANGLTRILAAAADSYTLSTRERIALEAVTIEAEG